MIGGSNKLVNVTELADMLGVAKRTAQTRWRDWGLPGYKVGGALRFRVRDVEAWLEKNRA